MNQFIDLLCKKDGLSSYLYKFTSFLFFCGLVDEPFAFIKFKMFKTKINYVFFPKWVPFFALLWYTLTLVQLQTPMTGNGYTAEWQREYR